jgi:polypeptide N-acetylgalactosaminyltransferase
MKLIFQYKLKTHFHFKPFRWYLENIYPESQLPRDYYYLGDIRPKKAKNVCLDSEKNILLYECLLDIRGSIPMHQLFLYTKQNQILNDENCLEATALNQTVFMKRCEQNKENQKWKYSERALTLTHMLTEACLEFFIDKETFGLILNECNGKRSQKWLLQDNFSWQSPTHIS